MTGEELRESIRAKWGYSYDLQLRRVRDRIYLQVMWRYQEQVSFPLSESAYIEHLNAIVSHLNAWNCSDAVIAFLQETREKPRLGKAVNIPLELGGDIASEWLL